MPKVSIPITNGFYTLDSLPVSAQRCVNLYPSMPEAPTATNGYLVNTFGITGLLDLSILRATCRGSRTMNEVPYFVIGDSLYRINYDGTDWSEELIGFVAGEGTVSIADNGSQLCIVTRGADIAYIYDEPTDKFEEITDANFDGPADNVVYVDGFFVFQKRDSSKFFNSALQDGRGAPDGTAYDPLDFSQAEADPDNIRGLQVSRSQLYVMGSQSVEIFRNIGRSPAPFVRVQGAVINVGLDARDSLQNFSGGIAFIGSAFNETAGVWVILGGNKQKISTNALDDVLSKLTQSELDAITSWYYADSGHFFYGFNLADTSFVFDATSKKWHERRSRITTELVRCRMDFPTTAYGEVLLGDAFTGRIGKLDRDNYLEYGVLQERFFTTQPFDNQGDPLFVSMIESVCETGVGLLEDIEIESTKNAQLQPTYVKGGKHPMLTLYTSHDNGRTFDDGVSRDLGTVGEYNKRLIWRRLGRFSREVVLKFEATTPNKIVIIKAEAQING